MKTTVVIPTYNEAENLPEITQALFSQEHPLHLLIVDDNSPDGTGKIADQLADTYPERFSVIHRTGKLGLGTAYIEGFQEALSQGADVVVQMDADFSHNPDRVPDLVARLDDNDLVIGSRYVRGGAVDERWALWRKGLSYFGNLYARVILGLPIQDVTGGFRAWRQETLAGMPLGLVKSNGYAFQIEMAYLAYLCGYSMVEIPIYFADRQLGDSKMSFNIQVEAALRVWAIRFSYRNKDFKNS